MPRTLVESTAACDSEEIPGFGGVFVFHSVDEFDVRDARRADDHDRGRRDVRRVVPHVLRQRECAGARTSFPLTLLLPIYGIVMAAHIAITRLGNVRLPQKVLGFTWEQMHLVLGFLCALMAVGWLVTDVGKKGPGFWLETIGGIALAFGAVNLQRERNTGVF